MISRHTGLRAAGVLSVVGVIANLILPLGPRYPAYGHPRYERVRRAAFETAHGSVAFYREYGRWAKDLHELLPSGNRRGMQFISSIARSEFERDAPLVYFPCDLEEAGRIVYPGCDGILSTKDDVTWSFNIETIKESALFPTWLVRRL